MSRMSVAALVALGFLSSVAVAFGVVGYFGANPEKADFDGVFAAVQSAITQHPEILNPAITAPLREGLRLAALKRLDLERFEE
jgi:hypothetical protein